MSIKTTFMPSNWVLHDDKTVTFWVNQTNSNRATKFGLKPTGISNQGAGNGFGAEKLKFIEYSFKIPRDAEILNEQTGSTISWKFMIDGITIVLTYRNQYESKNWRYIGGRKSIEQINALLSRN